MIQVEKETKNETITTGSLKTFILSRINHKANQNDNSNRCGKLSFDMTFLFMVVDFLNDKIMFYFVSIE